jgi:hypothetical protein
MVNFLNYIIEYLGNELDASKKNAKDMKNDLES